MATDPSGYIPIHQRAWFNVAKLLIQVAMLLFVGIGVVIQAFGPPSQEIVDSIPSIPVRFVLIFLQRFSWPIIMLIGLSLAYWRRDFMFKFGGSIYRFLSLAYARILAFFLRPVIRRIFEDSPLSQDKASVLGTLQIDKGKWEVIQGLPQTWQFGDAIVTGADDGHALYAAKLPNNCDIAFDATLLATYGSDEIDVLLGDVMVLFFNKKLRVDVMKGNLERDQGQPLDLATLPNPGETNHYEIKKRGSRCRYFINGNRYLTFECDQGREVFKDRFGFAVYMNKVEFKNIKVTAYFSI